MIRSTIIVFALVEMFVVRRLLTLPASVECEDGIRTSKSLGVAYFAEEHEIERILLIDPHLLK